MPGIERRMARYPQLYSRIGFSHRYAPLSKDELAFVLKRHWQHRGQEMSDDDFTDAQVMAAIARLTGGNFRLLQRLFVQVDRVLRINELSVVTAEVVEAAASALVIGHALAIKKVRHITIKVTRSRKVAGGLPQMLGFGTRHTAILEDAGCPSGSKGVELKGEILLDGRDAGVSDEGHGTSRWERALPRRPGRVHVSANSSRNQLVRLPVTERFTDRYNGFPPNARFPERALE